MAGNASGGKKAAAANIKRHGSDFYARIGRRGGKKEQPADSTLIQSKLWQQARRVEQSAQEESSIQSSSQSAENWRRSDMKSI